MCVHPGLSGAEGAGYGISSSIARRLGVLCSKVCVSVCHVILFNTVEARPLQ